MDEKRVLIEKFKSLHPFKENIIKDPFSNDIIDVETINKTAFDKVIEELKEVKESKKPDILILQGEPGSGKSHLLARIYRHAETERFLFALYNPLIVKIDSTYSSLLRSIFESFERKHSELKAKPINHIRGEIIHIGLKDYNLQEEPKIQVLLREIKKPKKTLLPAVFYENFMSLPKDAQNRLVKVISEETLKYIKAESNYTIGKKYLKAIIEALIDEEKYPLLRDLVNEGSLTNEDAKTLNLTSGFVVNEDIAFEIIQSIFLVSPFPILLSIDQIEHFDQHLDEKGIINFLEDLYRLVSNTKNVLLLLSAQTAVFRKWNSFLPEHLKDRFANVASLEGMRAEEGLEIIKKRNAYYFSKLGEQINDPYFPFNKEDILSKIKEHKLKSPRKVIELADEILEGKIIEKRSLKNEFENILKSQIYNKDDFEEAFGELLVTLLGGINLYPRGKKLVIQVNDMSVGIDNSKNYYSTVRKLASSLKKRKLNRAIFIRDEKMQLRSGTKSMELIKQNDISIRYYNFEEGKKLMAVQKLISLTESGDLELDTKEVSDFAKELLKQFLGEIPKKGKVIAPLTMKKQTKEKYTGEANNIVEEIVSKIKSDFIEGKINVARLSKYMDKKYAHLIPEVVQKLKMIESLYVKEQQNGEIFIAKKSL
ncbi:MAG: NB-ARC domain-containing protein [Caldisericum sp.]|uniref:NB-ARC domain-containing protein n=1 Tax=Caldisericum sp. TaxID=2499687 RepID=UPI003D0EAE64